MTHDSRNGKAAAIVTTEQRFRRRVLLGIAALLLLGMSPVLVHHVPIGLEGVLAGRDHVWAVFCAVALQAVLQPIHSVFHLLLFGGLAYAVTDRLRAIMAVRHALRPLAGRRSSTDALMEVAAGDAGLAPERVRVVQGPGTPALTIGWFYPRVYIARELFGMLSRAELRAVIAHEAEHVRRRDPLRLSALRFLSHALFWIPGLRALVDDFTDEAEIQADDRAARLDPLALASALIELSRWSPYPRSAAMVGFQTRDLLDRRIRRLAGEPPIPRSRIRRRSLVGMAALVLLAWSSATIADHPLGDREGAAYSAHCDHHEGLPFKHLFCRALAAQPAAGRDCLHADHATGKGQPVKS